MSLPKPDPPALIHVDSLPDLINAHGSTDNVSAQLQSLGLNLQSLKFESLNLNLNQFTDDVSDSDSDLEWDLLEYLSHIDLSYRKVKFNIPDKKDHMSEARKNYEKRVSFDTINIRYDVEEEVDDDWDFDSADRGRGRARSPDSSPLHSPSASPSRRLRSPLRNSLMALDANGFPLNRVLKNYGKPDYPTSPIITHNGCTFTKLHRKYEDLYCDRLNNKEHGFLSPVLPHRVILVYITARKHTWVALDWILNKFIENGDSVIIVSAIKSTSILRKRRNSSFAGDRVSAKTPRMRLKQRNRPDYVKVIAKNIMSYAMEVINPDVIAKVSIELAVGRSKKVLQEMYKLYEPNLVSTGTKPNLNISAPLRSWASSKITDRMVKNYPLPVIIVPAVNMGPFEKSLQHEINSRYENIGDQSPIEDPILAVSLRLSKPKKDDLDDNSSISSDDSYSSFEEISKAYQLYKKDLRNTLILHEQGGFNDPKYYTNALKSISDKSAEFCRDVGTIDPDFRGRGAKLARVLTGSNNFGISPHKTKSLLAPLEKAKTADVPSGPSNLPKINYKELKKKLMEKQNRSELSMTPSINIESPKTPDSLSSSPPKIITSGPSNSPPPPKQTLKFVNLETPQTATKKGKKDTKALHKSFSNEDTTSLKRPSLEPLKSHPDLHPVHDTGSGSNDAKEKKSKKKSRKFWRLFL